MADYLPMPDLECLYIYAILLCAMLRLYLRHCFCHIQGVKIGYDLIAWLGNDLI